MPKFKGGTSKHYPHGKKKGSKATPYLKITAGPLRGVYVHTLVAELMLGRPLENDETVEHKDGDGLNPHPKNLKVVTRKFNSYLRGVRARKAKRLEMGIRALEESWLEAKEEGVPF